MQIKTTMRYHYTPVRMAAIQKSSSLSAIRLVSSACLTLLMFLLAISISGCASSSPAFLMMYSAYKLNKQGNNIQPWHTPFPIWNHCVVPCPVLTVASWPAYRFIKRQVRWSGIPIPFRIFHSLVWSTLCAIRVVLSAHLRWLIFLLPILSLVCDSSSSAFCMRYSA